MTAVLTRPAPPAGTTIRPSRFDAAVRLAAAGTTWAAMLLVGYWWAADGGITDLGGWQSGLLSAGRITGLEASVLLLVQVLLMARIPVLEKAFGQHRLANIHRLVGFTSFTAMLAHLGLIVWGYAAGDLAATPAQLWDLTVNYPGMLLAVAGTACLVMVVVTSVKAARRRLRYESWHLLHLYAYLGVGLALPHQLWTGQEFTESVARTVFWWSLWAAAVLPTVIWRVATPLWRSARYRLRVSAVVDEGESVVSVWMTGRGAPIRAEAGQYLTFRFLDRRGWTRGNPYSLSAAPEPHRLRITARTVGDGSRELARLRPGTRVLIEGPYGRLSERARTRRGIVLIGAGIGLTPLRALAESAAYAPGEATLLYRFTGRPLFTGELRELARRRGLQLIHLPGHRRRRSSWLGQAPAQLDDGQALRRLVPDIAGRDVYVCGPQEWVEDVCRAAAAAGVAPEQLHRESFAMAGQARPLRGEPHAVERESSR